MDKSRKTGKKDPRSEYLHKLKTGKIRIHVLRIAILILFITLWEVLTASGILNPFIFSIINQYIGNYIFVLSSISFHFLFPQYMFQ